MLDDADPECEWEPELEPELETVAVDVVEPEPVGVEDELAVNVVVVVASWRFTFCGGERGRDEFRESAQWRRSKGAR